MGKGWLIVGGAALLGGGITLAARSKSVTTAAQVVATKIVAAERGVVRKVAKMAISNDVLDNFTKHNLFALIEQTRTDPKTGVAFPPSLAAAMIEIESTGDPGIFNYYPNGVGKPPKKVGHWHPGDPLPDGTNGQPNAWAAGLVQIIRKYPRGLTLAQRLDPLKSLQVIMPEWRTFYARASSAGLSGVPLWAAVYFAHNQGAGSQQKALGNLASGFEAAVTAASPSGARALAVALAVAARVPVWAALQATATNAAAGSFVAAPVDPSAPVVPPVTPVECEPSDATVGRADRGAPVPGRDRQSDIDALRVQIEQAEMARDLATAAALRAQLAALTGDATNDDGGGESA